MIEVMVSARNTGACPLCKRFDDCEILNAIRQACEKTAKPLHDDKMEIVIYRCPSFIET